MKRSQEHSRLAHSDPMQYLVGSLTLLGLALLGLALLSNLALGQGEGAASTLQCDQLIKNGGFETGDFSFWEASGPWLWVTNDLTHSGSYGALLGGNDDLDHTLYQHVVLSPTATTAALTYWWNIYTDEEPDTPYDFLYVEIQTIGGELLETLEVLSNASVTDTWQQSFIDLTEYPALFDREVRVVFRSTTDGSNPTGFFIDDVGLEVCEEDCPDPYEPNDDFEEPWPVEPGEIVESYICNGEDVDYFGLSVESGQEFRMTLDGPSGLGAASIALEDLPADYDLYLHDPAGEEVAYADSEGLNPESITHVAAFDGVYRAKIVVKPGNSVAVDPYRFRWHFVTSWTVNTTADHDDGYCEPLSIGDCTLREALNGANAGNPKQVRFNIPASDPGYQGGYWTIQPASALPDLAGAGILVDGTTQAAFIGGDPNPQGPEIRLDGAALGAGGVGLHLTSSDNVIRGLSIVNFDGAGVWIEGARSNQILGNTIGVEPLGDSAGNGFGVIIDAGAQGNLIGGRPMGDRNIISGNTYDGVWIMGSSTVSNTVVNNYIGTDASGSSAVANGENGVSIAGGAAENVIGGTDDGDRNLIGGNGADGVSISYPATTGNRVLGNYIGVNASGTAPVANGGNGIAIETDAHDNWIGDQGVGNLISGNDGNGIELVYAVDNHVRGNYIGVDVSGTKSISNTNFGVHINSGQGNVIGGSIRNVISGNGSHGIVVWWGASDNTIAGNHIGVSSSGSMALPNGGAGVYLGEGAQDNTVGGTSSGDRNIISGNATDGVSIYDPDTEGNKVQGNYIGLNFYRSAAIPNGGAGVFISNNAAHNLVGGAVSGAPNIISGNGGHGVAVIDLAVGNTVSRNSIYDNGGEGIYLSLGGNANLSPPAVVTITKAAAGQYTIRGTTCSGCLVEVFSDDEDEGRRYQGDVVANASGNFDVTVSRGRSYFTLNATNSSGSTSELSRDALPDLVTTGLEVTQAIQDLDNSVFLVENKRTHARFHVQADSLLDDDVPGVTAELYARKSTDGGGTWTRLGPLAPSNAGASITVRANPQRAQRDHSFYFELPPAWRTGMVTFEATVNPAGQIFETDPGNNQHNMPGILEYVKIPPLRLHFFTVTHTFTKTIRGVPTQMTSQATAAQLDAIEAWLRAAYPISSLSVRRRQLKYKGPTDQQPDGKEIIKQLAQIRKQAIKAKAHHKGTLYYGVAGDCNGRCFMQGWGRVGGYIASGPVGVPHPRSSFAWDTDGNYGDWYAGHELGHCLGRPHTRGAVPAAGQCGAEGHPVDQYPDGRIGGPAATPDRFAGWDVRTQQAYPSTWTDVMTYCPNEWISDITYDAMANKIKALDAATRVRQTRSTSIETLFIVGSINLTQHTGELGPGYRWMSDEAPTAPEPGGFRLRLEDGSGATLSETSFAAVGHLDPPPQDEDEVVPFDIEVPFHPSTARIVLLNDGVELASRPVSAHPPSVTVIAPDGGETLTETARVTWQADDADGDPLSYSVQYSCDGGTSWEPLAAELAGATFDLDTTSLPGGDQCLVRILATDGVNVGEDQSNGTFSVMRKAPSARILFPNGGWFTPAQTVVVEGAAHDPEDGDLLDDALVWLSDVDGVLGSGGSQAFAGLTPGEHTITLVATDSDEATGSDSIIIQVSETWPKQVYLPLVMRGH